MPPSQRTLASAVPGAQVQTTRLTAAISFGMPTVLAIILSVFATGLQVVNQVVLTGSPQWQLGIAVVLVFLAGEAIRPLTPGNLTTLIHLPEWLATLLTSIASALALVLQLAGIGHVGHVIVLAVVTFLVSLGFGGSAETVPVTVVK